MEWNDRELLRSSVANHVKLESLWTWCIACDDGVLGADMKGQRATRCHRIIAVKRKSNASLTIYQIADKKSFWLPSNDRWCSGDISPALSECNRMHRTVYYALYNCNRILVKCTMPITAEISSEERKAYVLEMEWFVCATWIERTACGWPLIHVMLPTNHPLLLLVGILLSWPISQWRMRK